METPLRSLISGTRTTGVIISGMLRFHGSRHNTRLARHRRCLRARRQVAHPVPRSLLRGHARVSCPAKRHRHTCFAPVSDATGSPAHPPGGDITTGHHNSQTNHRCLDI